jgi:hypothetical protein
MVICAELERMANPKTSLLVKWSRHQLNARGESTVIQPGGEA